MSSIFLPDSNKISSLKMRIGMGCWAIGGHGWGKVEDSDSIAAVKKAFEMGVTFFDTADVYGLGKSESLLQTALGNKIQDVCIATKGGVRWDNAGKVWNDISPAYLRSAVENSLKRLSLDCIPLYYLHKPDGRTPVKKAVEALTQLVDAGKIQAIGLSNFSVTELREALEVAPVSAVQLQFNILNPYHGFAMQALCQQNHIKLVAWGVLADGLLTGKFNLNSTFADDDHRSRLDYFKGDLFIKYLAKVESLKEIALRKNVPLSQLALRWVMDKFSWAIPLFGAKNHTQVVENLGTIDWQLSNSDMRQIETIQEVN